MNRRTRIAGRLVWDVVVIAIFGVALIRHHDAPAARRSPSKGAPSYWYDPMHPSQHFDKPGKSPFMDMPLVPKYADGATSHAGGASPATLRSTRASLRT